MLSNYVRSFLRAIGKAGCAKCFLAISGYVSTTMQPECMEAPMFVMLLPFHRQKNGLTCPSTLQHTARKSFSLLTELFQSACFKHTARQQQTKTPQKAETSPTLPAGFRKTNGNNDSSYYHYYHYYHYYPYYHCYHYHHYHHYYHYHYYNNKYM